ncbi:cell envelope integrity protein CreD [Curvibacter sp. APW13]|uniref:cell envelope integrity protein CreD n=1 Tax=Curvibacter sp. APW13 TaxID=3077236 RepID=UPI0028DEC474|nr:cell envelope integrity protein CreD [Curvibacter sp. APW13]MDT8990490.1 cell envelope integrity protein CreD [Curvibacter sp. APW13]
MKSLGMKKALALVAIVLVLMLGLDRIEGVVRDRAYHRNLATQAVSQSLAGAQTLLGPLLHVSCVETWDVLQGNEHERKLVEQRQERTHVLAPTELSVGGDAAPQVLKRGLYPIPTYLLHGQIQARWDQLEALRPAPTQKNSRLQCGAPVLMVAVTDTRGVRSAKLTALGQERMLKPGTFHAVYKQGLHALLPDAVRHQTEPLQVQLNLELAGTEQLSIVPLGEQSTIHVRSAWPHPSFGGHFLPSEREVRADGFDAHWRLSALATSASQDVVAGKPLCAWSWNEGGPGEEVDAPPIDNCAQSVRLRLIDPINPYTLADRATKYGLLFVALTFVTVGLVELLQRRAVHPVQYLLVGSALSAFFLLLLSLSEHLPFALAYGVAASACVLLLGYYAVHMLGRLGQGLLLGLGIGVLYGVLFVLLRLEQTALVVGSVALFAVLASIMVLTRKVDWYGLGQGARSGEAGVQA